MSKVFKDRNYYQIEGWMINQLDLSGSKLMIYAVIYGFSQDNSSHFRGSLAYLQQATGSSKSTVLRSLRDLVDDGLLLKQEVEVRGFSFPIYQAIQNDTTGIKMTPHGIKMTPDRYQNDTTPGVKMTPNNKVYNNKVYNKDNTKDIGADAQKKSDDGFEDSFDEAEDYSKKEKKVAQKKEKKFDKSDFRKALIEEGADPQHVEDWLKVRTSKRAAFTQTALNQFLNECHENNFPVAQAVQICAERSWQGFKYQWILNDNQNGKTNANQTRQDRLDRVNRGRDLALAILQSGSPNSY